MTKDQLISDVILRLTKGKPSDDLELERSQVAFWISIARDFVLKRYLEKRLTEGEPIDNTFIFKDTCKELNIESDFCLDDCNRIYAILSKNPLDLSDDLGVVRVRTNDGQRVDKTDISAVDMIMEMEFCKPSVENLVYYREGQKLVIMGVPESMKDLVYITAWYVPKEDLSCLAETDEVNITPDLLMPILDAAEEIGRRQLFGPEDLENDGQQDISNNA